LARFARLGDGLVEGTVTVIVLAIAHLVGRGTAYTPPLAGTAGPTAHTARAESAGLARGVEGWAVLVYAPITVVIAVVAELTARQLIGHALYHRLDTGRAARRAHAGEASVTVDPLAWAVFVSGPVAVLV